MLIMRAADITAIAPDTLALEKRVRMPTAIPGKEDDTRTD